MKKLLWTISFVVVAVPFSPAQQTVFNVPSADVLAKGKFYGELDVTYRNSSGGATLTPRAVVGVGHRFEAGINLNGFGLPGQQSFTPTPTLKWEIYDGQHNGWSWLVGDDLYIPAQNRTYNVGNYVWTELAHAWKSGTRATFGAFQISPNVVAVKQKAGGQFAIEQRIDSRVTFAIDWFTGDSSIGYLTPGVVIKVTRQLTWYATYQLGNHRLTEGNHQFLFELGWNFN